MTDGPIYHPPPSAARRKKPSPEGPVERIAWDHDVQFLKGVGPVRARALARLGIATAGDLLRHYPRRWLDRTRTDSIGSLRPGQEATIRGEVLTSGGRSSRGGRSLQTVSVGDATGVLFCQWFGQSYVLKQFRSGTKVLLSGQVQIYNGRKQIVHPDFEILDGDAADADPLHTGRLVPVYPLTSGLGQHWLRRLIHDTLDQLAPAVEDPLPADLRRARGLEDLGPALWGIHFPQDAAARDAARRRLAHDEIFLVQLALALRRRGRRGAEGLRLDAPGDLTRRLVDGLPFPLTGAQRRVLGEILRDLRSGRVMHRLLQGDVGSGKTLVALIAALFVIEQGRQAVLMAPTEVLARQHGATLQRLCKPLGVAVETLTGSTPAAARRAVLAGAAAGEIDLLVGTHAVIQQDVELPALGLAVVDEQHRFGVRQRGRTLTGGEAGVPPHLLVMSATPIPRSLALTLCGDLDLSLIDELPAGRTPIETRLVPPKGLGEVHAAIRAEAAAGRRAYVVYPVIEETEGQDLKAAQSEYERLAAGPLAGLRVGLLHGRLKPAEKARAMEAFAAGELQVLVATTVVEVGLDVPEATVMVIHHPDRFGLAQLHQLRGRVGRGADASRCWLAPEGWLPDETLERLRLFCRTHDGFVLAEEDLRRRGPGDVIGVRQHGAPSFRLANPLRDGDLVEACRTDVDALIAADPALEDPAHAPLARALARDHGRILAAAVG
ncbi:MAG TPA: ATP-dependent DNA helicase RecG [Candidatus Krumholzibacteria bacterium]|nr:ATP-dependent DNA helicase RecG [Candidatus Krumholzibacteria bacterium]HRX50034.1 ATP-dependent DNA helicase RecG [Candidatus Krumholzibacteria bacterium]